MTICQRTYDGLLRYAPPDGHAVATLARALRAHGMRIWFDRWSALPGTSLPEELQMAQAAARADVLAVGPSGIPPRVDGPEGAIWTLLPGCPLSTGEVAASSDGPIVDLRSGLNAPNAIEAVIASIRDVASARFESSDLEYPLGGPTLMRRTIRSYDAIAEKFAAQWFEHPPIEILDLLLDLMGRHGCILDAGCGPGHHAKYLAMRGQDVVGIDLSEGMLGIAKGRVDGVTFRKMDIRRLAFAGQTFDAVWCAGAAMHVPREEAVELLTGFRRVLRPNGVLGLNLQVDKHSELVRHDEDHRFFEYYRDFAEVERLLSYAGFDPVARNYGKTNRNTHGLDITLQWATVYARPSQSHKC